MNFDKYENTKPFNISLRRKEFYRNVIEGVILEKQEEYKDIRKEYHEENAKLRELFRKDVEEELFPEGLPDDVKDKIHDLAWKDGHSYGYGGVYGCYDKYIELAELCVSQSK